MLSSLAIMNKRSTTSCNSVEETEEKILVTRWTNHRIEQHREQQDSKVTNLQTPHRR